MLRLIFISLDAIFHAVKYTCNVPIKIIQFNKLQLLQYMLLNYFWTHLKSTIKLLINYV
jgi:hypothetical protein